jgi:small neutral amino acid transporter SnatA (MarC family)
VEANASGSGGDDPSAWLWVAVLVLALNPARAAFAVPRARSQPTVAGMAAAGGALGGLAVCIAAAVGAPLLDALHVSDPSFRVAAGLLAGLTGIADLFRRSPRPEPGLPGWRAVLVPIAVPVVARPALLVLALGAGADLGIAVSIAAMAVGAALLTVLAAGCPPDGPGGRVLLWASRALGAALVACGALLLLDGVLDV